MRLIRDDGSLTLPVVVTPGLTPRQILLPAAPDFELIVDNGMRERSKFLLGEKVDDERVHTADRHLLPWAR